MESLRKKRKLGRLATETFAALDAMEENMRELGIGYDGAEDPVKGDSIAGVCSTYMEKIRAKKEEQQKLRAERVLREFLAESQTGDVDRQEPNEDVERIKTNRLLEHATTLLKTDRASAHRVAELRLDEELNHRLRRERIQKYRALGHDSEAARSQHPAESEKAAKTCVLPPAVDCEVAEVSKDSSDDLGKRQSSLAEPAEEHCRALARGLIELAFCVSNNRFLDAADINGRPVRRLQQDLPVTTWRSWVRKYLWRLDDETDAWQGHSGPRCEHSLVEMASLDAKSSSVFELQSPQSSKLRGEDGINTAQEHLEFAAEQMGSHLSDMQARAVEEGLKGLQVEKERLQRNFLEDIRRRFDENQRPDDGEVLEGKAGTSPVTASIANIGPNCSPPTRRSEIIPGWMHRMPPAGCFVFGDDLSGVCLCADTIDRAHASSAANSLPTKIPGHAVGATEDMGSSLNIQNSTTPSASTSFLFQPEDGYQKVFMTPRVFQAFGRSPLTSRNRLAISSISNLKNVFRRSSTHVIEEDEHREFDTMAEQLCHELVNTHLHNLHVLTSGLVPSIRWPLGPPSQYKEQPHGGTTPASPLNELSELNDPIPPLRYLFLFNFPNSTLFYRILQQKLQLALESAERFLQGVLQRQHQNNVMDSGPIANLLTSSLLRGVGNYGGGAKVRSTSFSASHSTLQRGKGGRSGSARSKGIRNTTNSMMVDSNSRDETASTDSPLVILPPLCVLGFFVEYNLPTRQQRLQEAYFHLPEPPGGRNSDGTIDTASSSNTGVSFQQIYHNSFRPGFPLTGAPPGKEANLASPLRTTLAFSSGSPSQGLHPKTGSGNPAGSTSLSNSGANPKRPRAMRAQDWSASCLRQELILEDTNMRRWREDWKNAFEPTASVVSSEPTVVTNTQPFRGANPAPTHGHSKLSSKKKANSASQTPYNASGASISLQSESERLSSPPQGPSDANECVNSVEAAAATVNFPRVLFFFRNEDFSFNTISSKQDPNSELDKTLSGDCTKSAQPHSHENIKERVKSSEYLISRITETVRNSSLSKKLFTNESVCPHQLPAPLRLSDYRLPSSICGELVQVHRAQSSTHTAPPSQPDHAKIDKAVRIHTLRTEVQVFGCLMRFLTQLLHLLRDSAFLQLLCYDKVDDKLKQTDTLTGTRTLGNSKTVYYATVDRNFQESQNTVRALANEHREKLLEACCIWLEQQLAIGLETMAGGLEMMISNLKRRSPGRAAASTTEKEESSAASSLLVMLPVLEGDKLKELIRNVMLAATPSVASDVFWPDLNEYFKKVEAAAVACVLRSVLSQAEMRIGEESPVANNPQAELVSDAMLEDLVPVMVRKLLARLFALPQEDRTTAQSPPPTNLDRGGEFQVSSYITRCCELVCEVLFCFKMSMNGCFDWLHGMYQVAINKPSDGSSLPMVRPHTVPDIFLPPAPTNACGVKQEKAKSFSGLNVWVRLNMKLFITSFSIFGRSMLKEEEFLYANVLTQLARMEHLLPAASRTLGDFNGKDERQEDSSALMETLCCHCWFDSFLLSAPCRAKETAPLSFLSLKEMQNLFREASKVPTEEEVVILPPAEGGDMVPPILANARHFITNLALRRWCFCSSTDLKEGGYPCSAVSAIPEPTIRELRAVIMTLPAQLSYQAAEPVSIGENSEKPNANAEAAWQSMRWWWLNSSMIAQPNGGRAPQWVWAVQNEDIPLVLLHLLRSNFALGPRAGGAGHLCPAYPPLRRVLKFVARVSYSKMATIERTFHTIAALQSRQQIGFRNTERVAMNTVEGNVAPPPAMAVDNLELSVETFCEFFSNSFEVTKAPLSLACDVRLMLQREGAQAVTLPLLLSSHWGRLVLGSHSLG